MQLTHEVGRFIQVRTREAAAPLFRYVYGGKPKPFFHPLCTPGGHCLTLFEPHDHVWHRGLWFTIKFVNGENFWEEPADGAFGTQVIEQPPTALHTRDGGIAISHAAQWLRPAGAGVIINEQRSFTYVPVSEMSYLIDFQTSLSPTADVLLDRTPFGNGWGGYGGLCFRGTRNWQQTQYTFSTGEKTERPLGVPAAWCDMSGKLDGGLDLTGGVAIFDHPSNARHPSPWYGRCNDSGHYFNPAFLFHEPMKLAAGATLKLRYAVLVHDGLLTPAELQSRYDSWLAV